MSERIIQADRSVIVAADVQVEELHKLVESTSIVEGIGGYKVGLALALEKGLPYIVDLILYYTDLPVIYDHQKAGNDIPAMGATFAKVCRNAGIDAVILFPFAGPETEKDWIQACQDQGLGVIVGAHMTQPKFLVSERGFVADESPDRMFTIAVEKGVRDFVIPGNKIEYVQHYKDLFDSLLGKGNFTLYAPGFITQGGEISEFAQRAGRHWHAIVGGAIYKPEDMTAAANEITKNIR